MFVQLLASLTRAFYTLPWKAVVERDLKKRAANLKQLCEKVEKN